MLDTKGDTAVYLLFAYARVASILRKASTDKGVNIEALCAPEAATKTLQHIPLTHPAERALAFELMQLGDVIRSVLKDLLPNRYVLSLSLSLSLCECVRI